MILPAIHRLRLRLAYESELVWEEDPSRLDCVRVRVGRYPHREKIRQWRGPGRRVGYSVASPAAPPAWGRGGFWRREFFVLEHDRACDPAGVYLTGCLADGVDPRTLSPGEPGELTARAWGIRPGERLPTLEDFLRDIFDDPPA